MRFCCCWQSGAVEPLREHARDKIAAQAREIGSLLIKNATLEETIKVMTVDVRKLQETHLERPSATVMRFHEKFFPIREQAYSSRTVYENLERISNACVQAENHNIRLEYEISTLRKEYSVLREKHDAYVSETDAERECMKADLDALKETHAIALNEAVTGGSLMDKKTIEKLEMKTVFLKSAFFAKGVPYPYVDMVQCGVCFESIPHDDVFVNQCGHCLCMECVPKISLCPFCRRECCFTRLRLFS